VRAFSEDEARAWAQDAIHALDQIDWYAAARVPANAKKLEKAIDSARTSLYRLIGTSQVSK
jgi:hypothetical protein